MGASVPEYVIEMLHITKKFPGTITNVDRKHVWIMPDNKYGGYGLGYWGGFGPGYGYGGSGFGYGVALGAITGIILTSAFFW